MECGPLSIFCAFLRLQLLVVNTILLNPGTRHEVQYFVSQLYSSKFTPVIDFVLILWSILTQFPHSSHIYVPLHLKQCTNTEDIINILHLQFQLSARSWCHSWSASSVPFVSPCSDKSTTVEGGLVDWAAARPCSPWRLRHKQRTCAGCAELMHVLLSSSQRIFSAPTVS